jgi:hypothetical protein
LVKESVQLDAKESVSLPAPQRTGDTWATLLRCPAHASRAADFVETTTLTGAHRYVLAVIERATRRVRILGATAIRPPHR